VYAPIAVYSPCTLCKGKAHQLLSGKSPKVPIDLANTIAWKVSLIYVAGKGERDRVLEVIGAHLSVAAITMETFQTPACHLLARV
jgi:hypothetical protein